ncbi:16S rRNA (guanine(527)-N(7))-methyltransferase RsmG [Salibacterium halotolerans]|uniref:Ribosomal RNA small subunit methyltransferase G n=1 Tax=Salibacterium halotolerans TaxID=1884432 RepID=A0A1I5U4E3_9BACI|nr:16S rRNA (guanine(527)-N(7))-methyltransferase RsmG [Salibacterium halotolerans]SFP90143.1 16S rRNA (guanine527-N7)-methyltransferase [Salibacterium halotolerans]
MTRDVFSKWLQDEGMYLTDEQLNQFDAYYHKLIEWNQKVNLTSLTEKADVYEKHFYDSLTPAFYYDFQHDQKLVDIGAGAGFPSLPLKIIHPHLHIVIIDSLKKRISFLEELIDELQLQQVQVLHGRAEDKAREALHREQYDTAISRAVAKMPVLTELCLPFVKQGGRFLALKGAEGLTEKEQAGKACRALGGRWKEAAAFTLPNEESSRYILEMEKVDAVAEKYPRKAGTPSKKPIL